MSICDRETNVDYEYSFDMQCAVEIQNYGLYENPTLY